MQLVTIVSAIILPQVGQDMRSRWVVEGAKADEFESALCTLEGSKLLGILSSDSSVFLDVRADRSMRQSVINISDATAASSANISTSTVPMALFVGGVGPA